MTTTVTYVCESQYYSLYVVGRYVVVIFAGKLTWPREKTARLPTRLRHSAPPHSGIHASDEVYGLSAFEPYVPNCFYFHARRYTHLNDLFIYTYFHFLYTRWLCLGALQFRVTRRLVSPGVYGSHHPDHGSHTCSHGFIDFRALEKRQSTTAVRYYILNVGEEGQTSV